MGNSAPDSTPHHTQRVVHVVADVNQPSNDVITISLPIWAILVAISARFSQVGQLSPQIEQTGGIIRKE